MSLVPAKWFRLFQWRREKRVAQSGSVPDDRQVSQRGLRRMGKIYPPAAGST